MLDNHKHHAAFMATVFSIHNYELLCKTVAWVYRAYYAHKFSFDYFPQELNAWKDAIKEHITGTDVSTIQAIYSWMLANHENFIAVSQSDVELEMPVLADWETVKSVFQTALLHGDSTVCLNIALESIKDSDDVEQFYQQVIHPAMYEIGLLWEQGHISVAQEHLASAIVGRIMVAVSVVKRERKQRAGKIVVTSSPNKLHEIGAWMVSEIFELAGWEVRYLGANTP